MPLVVNRWHFFVGNVLILLKIEPMLKFKTYSEVIFISQEDAHTRLKQILSEQPYFQWTKKSRSRFFKGSVSKNEFSVQSAYFYETLRLVGHFSGDSKGNVNVHMQPQIVWFRYILYALLIFIIGAALIFLSTLMLKANFLFGLLAYLLSIILSAGLFYNLIGYKKRKSELLRHAFMKRLMSV